MLLACSPNLGPSGRNFLGCEFSRRRLSNLVERPVESRVHIRLCDRRHARLETQSAGLY
jgi:hypothetical protein